MPELVLVCLGNGIMSLFISLVSKLFNPEVPLNEDIYNAIEEAKEMEREQKGYSEEDVKNMLYKCCDVLENNKKSFWNIDGLVDEIILTFKSE